MLTFEYDRVKINQTSRSHVIEFKSYCPDAQTHTHTHTGATALFGPLKYSVEM